MRPTLLSSLSVSLPMAFPHSYVPSFPLIIFAFLSFQIILGIYFIYFFLNLGQEKLYGKPITLADREIVEEKADGILSEARESDVAFLVVGDPFGYATFLVCFCFVDCSSGIIFWVF